MRFRIASLLGCLLISCTAVRSTTSNSPASDKTHTTESSSSVHRKDITDYAATLVGTPYRYGGVSPKSGFDCSGFTSFVLKNFGWSVPRTSTGQAGKGKVIKYQDAQPGDLLFFGRPNHIDHVAIIYRNSGHKLEMIHSSTSHGVIIEDALSSPYWKKRLLYAVDLNSL